MKKINLKTLSEPLNDNELKNIKGGQMQGVISCTATKEGSTTKSYYNESAELMYSWARVWESAGYGVECHTSYMV